MTKQPGVWRGDPNWILMSDAFVIATKKFGSKRKAEKRLLAALADGEIESRADVRTFADGRGEARNIHFNTDQFMLWLQRVTAKRKP